MSLQWIIDTAVNMDITRSPIITQTISRGNRIRTATRGASVWTFRVTPAPGLSWTQYRAEITQLQNQDRFQEWSIRLNNNPNLAWIHQYLGDMDYLDREFGVRYASHSGDTITVNNLPVWTEPGSLYRPGDIIRVAGSRYPYQVINNVFHQPQFNPITGELTWPTTQTIQVHRPVLPEPMVLVPGNFIRTDDVPFRVMVTRFPDIGVRPGQLITFDGDFELMEVIL